MNLQLQIQSLNTVILPSGYLEHNQQKLTDRVNFSNLFNTIAHSIKADFDVLLPGQDDLIALFNELKVLVSRQILLVLQFFVYPTCAFK